MRLIYSAHALIRLAERDITRSEVEEVISNPESVYNTPPHPSTRKPMKTYVGGRLVVIAEPPTTHQEQMVVTVHLRDGHSDEEMLI